jgi:glutaminyl-tRNA synthetase
MPTIRGMRRRGLRNTALIDFCELVGVTRAGNENVISIEVLENCIRKDLENVAKRTLGIIDPVKVVLTNIDANYT